MSFHDAFSDKVIPGEGTVRYKTANSGASRFMKAAFDIDTTNAKPPTTKAVSTGVKPPPHNLEQSTAAKKVVGH